MHVHYPGRCNITHLSRDGAKASGTCEGTWEMSYSPLAFCTIPPTQPYQNHPLLLQTLNLSCCKVLSAHPTSYMRNITLEK